MGIPLSTHRDVDAVQQLWAASPLNRHSLLNSGTELMAERLFLGSAIVWHSYDDSGSGRNKHGERIPALCQRASSAEQLPSGQQKRREMTHTTLEHGQRFQRGKHRATVARAVNSTIAQLLARGSILIHPLGIRVQLGQDELTILRHVAKEPNPVAKAEIASSGVSQGAHAAVPQGLP